jgi:hypothetical protein
MLAPSSIAESRRSREPHLRSLGSFRRRKLSWKKVETKPSCAGVRIKRSSEIPNPAFQFDHETHMRRPLTLSSPRCDTSGPLWNTPRNAHSGEKQILMRRCTTPPSGAKNSIALTALPLDEDFQKAAATKQASYLLLSSQRPITHVARKLSLSVEILRDSSRLRTRCGSRFER